jgi:hypothetical protein
MDTVRWLRTIQMRYGLAVDPVAASWLLVPGGVGLTACRLGAQGQHCTARQRLHYGRA